VVPLAAGMMDVIVGVMVEILCVLAIVTKDIKQNRAGESTHSDKSTLLA
jgi:hypothetical protein